MEGSSRRTQEEIEIIKKWKKPNRNVVKINIEGTTRAKLRAVGIRVLHNSGDKDLVFFFSPIGSKDSNEGVLLEAGEALRFFGRVSQASLLWKVILLISLYGLNG